MKEVCNTVQLFCNITQELDVKQEKLEHKTLVLECALTEHDVIIEIKCKKVTPTREDDVGYLTLGFSLF